jgi:hypothetical protein
MNIIGLAGAGVSNALGIIYGTGGYRSHIDGSIGTIELDATYRENHEWDSTVTSNPVEGGSPITDHIILSPDTLSLNGIVSDASMSMADTGGLLAQAVSSRLPLPAGDIVPAVLGQLGALESPASRVQAAFDMLHDLRDARQTVIAFTRYRIYRDMVIRKVTIPRDRSAGDAIEFTLDLVNIRLVQTQLVDLPAGIGARAAARAASVANKATQKVQAGAQQTTDAGGSVLKGLENVVTSAAHGDFKAAFNQAANAFKGLPK